MCGIAGVLDVSERAIDLSVLDRMGDALAHRGPDDADVFAEGAVGLSHRRLSIIDLTAAGRQPMASPDGRHVMVYNGETFNFAELGKELEGTGHVFRSRTDSEVVLAALARWGLDALERFNGMFAFAWWDRKARRLVLSRDRYGIKPLYYSWCGERLVFGSEVKAILASGFRSAELDRASLLEYLSFQNLFTERTLFEGVRLLSPGTWLSVDLADGGHKTGRYWDFQFVEPTNPPERTECAEELRRLFDQAVVRQLVSDVPVSSYLSGGMDSGSITAVAAQHVPNLRTFTVGFDMQSASGMELGFDERDKAEHMSYLFQTEHYEMVLKAGDMERVMPRLIWHMEEPRVGQSYPNFYAHQLAGKFGKVVLSGAGGDELFGGYPWRYYRAVVNDDFEHYIDKYYDFWQRLLPSDVLRDVLAPIWSDVAQVSTRDIFRNVFTDHADRFDRPEDYIHHSLYFEAKTFLHGLLVIEDKLSMAHGLEVRVPFLDNDLVDFAQELPASYKLGNLGEVIRLNENEPGPKTKQFYNATSDGKLLLRRMMEHYVPPAVARAQKQGFSGPDASWYRGESIDYVRRTLLEKDARIYDYLDRASIWSLVEDHLAGGENRRLLIWSLLCLEEWCRTFLEGDVRA